MEFKYLSRPLTIFYVLNIIIYYKVSLAATKESKSCYSLFVNI